MTEDIRKKHEAQVTYTKEKQGDFSYLFQSIQSNLRISDVDALFAALDEAKDGLTAAHMHGFEEGRDQYRDKVRKLQAALDAERELIIRFLSCERTIMNGGLMDNYTDVARARKRQAEIIEQFRILTGEGK